MKQLLIFSCCFLATTSSLFSQSIDDYTIDIQDSIDYNYYERTAEMLELLDLSDVTSGILYEREFQFVMIAPSLVGNISD